MPCRIGQLALQHDVVVVGARDVAGAAGAGAALVDRLVHGGEHGGMLAHVQVIVAAPHGHPARLAAARVGGARGNRRRGVANRRTPDSGPRRGAGPVRCGRTPRNPLPVPYAAQACNAARNPSSSTWRPMATTRAASSAFAGAKAAMLDRPPPPRQSVSNPHLRGSHPSCARLWPKAPCTTACSTFCNSSALQSPVKVVLQEARPSASWS